MQRTRSSNWSKLNPVVLRKIFDSLSPIDHDRAKHVCLDWYSVWKTCFNHLPCPSRFIHQGHGSSSLLNPEQDTRKLEGQGLDKNYCMASYESWLLMIDSRLDFYLLNLLTRKRVNRVNLPSMNSPIRGGQVSFERERGRGGYGRFVGPSRTDNVSKDVLEWKNSAVLWIDETTGDYMVAWIFRQHYLFTYKRGDESWLNLIPQGFDSGFLDVAYKNSKLYVLTTDQHIKIFVVKEKQINIFNMSIEEITEAAYRKRPDFVREEITEGPYWNRPFTFDDEQPWEYVWKRKIAIEESGEVLIILSLQEVRYDKRLLFYVFKMNLESCKWERVYSIGDNQLLIFGHGVTVNAPVRDFGDGIKSDIICFVEDDVWPDHQDHEERASDCGVFDLATSRIEWPKKLRYYINETQWFVPGVAY